MSSETVNVKFDLVKLVIAALVVIAAIAAFYVFDDQSTPLRVAGILVATGVAAWIGLQTEPGRNLWNFLQDAQVEVRKVVWPTRQETAQTTLLVIAVVILAALILWGLDTVLGWAIRQLIGGPGG
jgi:preprotein translocase subunit SecE